MSGALNTGVQFLIFITSVILLINFIIRGIIQVSSWVLLMVFGG